MPKIFLAGKHYERIPKKKLVWRRYFHIRYLKMYTQPGTTKICFLLFSNHLQKKWYPDTDWIKDYDGPVMFPEGKTKYLRTGYWSGKIQPKEVEIKTVQINFGPNHPAAHGVLRLIMHLDGEVIKRLDPHVGLLHRGTEKLMEYKTFHQALPYVDRLDYISMMANEQCYSLAVEKLCHIEVPLRAQYIRGNYSFINE